MGKQITLRLSDEEFAAIEQIARREYRSVNAQARKWISEAVKSPNQSFVSSPDVPPLPGARQSGPPALKLAK